MTGSREPRPPMGPVLERAGWGSVGDALLAGLCHDLNGRVSALSSIAELLAMGESVERTLPTFRKEARRLEETVRLLRLFPGNPDGPAEPLLLSDLLPALLTLHRRERGLDALERTLECGSLPPVLVNWTAVGRGLLLAWSAVGHAALRNGRSRVDAVFRPHGEGLRGVIRAAGETGSPPRVGPDAPGRDSGARREALVEVFRRMGGGADVGDGETGLRVALTLPSLAAVRARRD